MSSKWEDQAKIQESRKVVKDLLEAKTIDEVARILIVNFPELLMLLGDVHVSPEAFVSDTSTVGRRLFPNLSPEAVHEFDRTMLGTQIFLWLLKGDEDSYRALTACQPQERKLSLESFNEIHAFVVRLFDRGSDGSRRLDPQTVLAAVIGSVYGDIGKVAAISGQVRDVMGVGLELEPIYADRLIQVADERMHDHDDILDTVLNHFHIVRRMVDGYRKLLPSLGKLLPEARELLRGGLVGGFNLAQYNQGEIPAAGLRPLKDTSLAFFDFYVVHVLCDIAGAAGHARQDGSLILNDEFYDGFRSSVESVRAGLRNPSGWDERAVYKAFMAIVGTQLGLDVSTPIGEASVRLCLMARLKTREQAQVVVRVLNELDPATRVVLVDELARSGIGDGFAIAPVYFPACIQSAYRAYLHAGSPNALSEALVASLPMLARAMTDVRRLVADRTGDGMFAVDLKALAEVLKEPGSLHQWAFSFTEVTDGAVLTVARS